MRCALLVGLCFFSRTALACACCEWEETRQPLAWSEDGLRLLVEVKRTGCNPIRGLEIWDTGRDKPSTCHDLVGPDPTATTDCSEWTVDMHAVLKVQDKTAFSMAKAAVSDFTHLIAPPSQQALGRLRKVQGDAATAQEPHPYCFERKAGEGWQEIWRGPLHPADLQPEADTTARHPLVARLVAAPTGDSGLLWIQHAKGPSPAGTNAWIDQIHWVEWGTAKTPSVPEVDDVP